MCKTDANLPSRGDLLQIGSDYMVEVAALRAAIRHIAGICPADDAARGYVGNLLRAVLAASIRRLP